MEMKIHRNPALDKETPRPIHRWVGGRSWRRISVRSTWHTNDTLMMLFVVRRIIVYTCGNGMQPPDRSLMQHRSTAPSLLPQVCAFEKCSRVPGSLGPTAIAQPTTRCSARRCAGFRLYEDLIYDANTLLITSLQDIRSDGAVAASGKLRPQLGWSA